MEWEKLILGWELCPLDFRGAEPARERSGTWAWGVANQEHLEDREVPSTGECGRGDCDRCRLMIQADEGVAQKAVRETQILENGF